MSEKPIIYLNACSHGLPDVSVKEEIARQSLQPEDLFHGDASLREQVRATCASFLRTSAEQVGFGSGTFQSWSTAMARLPAVGGRILVAAHEWGDHVVWLRHMAQRMNIKIDVVPISGGQALDPAAWAAKMDDDVIALCFPLVTSIQGVRYPAEDIAAIQRPDEALIFLDVAQALGRVPVKPETLGCDVLVGTARKWLRGPRQTAMYWLSERAQAVLACRARDIEPFDLNTALLAGLQKAVDQSVEYGIAQCAKDIADLERVLRSGLAACDAMEILPPQTVGTVCCSVPRQLRSGLDSALRDEGIVATWCNPVLNEPLSTDGGASDCLRLSPHVYNSLSEIDTVVDTITHAEQALI